MPVNWNGLERIVTAYFASYSAPNFTSAAQFIASQYDMAVRVGGEMIANNFVVTGNPAALQAAITMSFGQGYAIQGGLYNSLAMIANGLMMYWTGAVLSLAFPPPGTIAVVSNFVTSPGTATGFITPPSTSFDTWIKAFIMMARMHLMTVQGQIIALVPTPTGPIPIPIPWIGYR